MSMENAGVMSERQYSFHIIYIKNVGTVASAEQIFPNRKQHFFHLFRPSSALLRRNIKLRSLFLLFFTHFLCFTLYGKIRGKKQQTMHTIFFGIR